VLFFFALVGALKKSLRRWWLNSSCRAPCTPSQLPIYLILREEARKMTDM